ncbi:MAG: citrate lyase subunit beta/citryl-CoA lyase [Alphaproteobacteria bacterium]|jgi:citrate lyase subunit beta/citryl-CoA lyase
MPGANARALEKARTLPADGFIFDLEDAVAPDAKALARLQVCDALTKGGYGARERVVRVNSLDSPWGDADIAAIAAVAPGDLDAVLLPKVEGPEMVEQVVSALASHGARDDLPIWCMIETPMGVLRVEALAAAWRARIGALVMGTSDLATDLHCAHTPARTAFLYSLSHCIVVARAYGVAVLDGVHLDLSDDEGFKASCQQGRALGFDGKTLIHPKTIAAANAVFGPDSDAVTWSRRVIAAFDAAAADGKGVVLLDGQLIENLHVTEARRVVTLAENIERLENA